MKNKLLKKQFTSMVKRVLCVALSVQLVMSGDLTAGSVSAYNMDKEEDIQAIDIYTNGLFSNLQGKEFKLSEHLVGDFELTGIEENVDSVVLNQKILEYSPKYDSEKRLNPLWRFNPNNKANVRNLTGSRLYFTWGEMIAIAMSNKTGTASDNSKIKFTQMNGYNITKPYYGSNRIEAFKNAVLNESRYTDSREQQNKNQLYPDTAFFPYVKAVTMWGDGETIYQDIKKRFADDNTPCYCMLVESNSNDYLHKDVYGYIGKPYVYVLYFHNFAAANRSRDYLTSAGDNIAVGDTIDTLAEKGITYKTEDTRSNTGYSSKDLNGADLYYAENKSGNSAEISTEYSVEEGTSTTITEESSYTDALSKETSIGASLSYSIPIGPGGIGGEIGAEFSVTNTTNVSVESSSTFGKENTEEKIETHTKSYSMEMPAHTRSTLTIQPTETTVSYRYDSKISPDYQVDIMMYGPKYYFPNLYENPVDNQVCYNNDWLNEGHCESANLVYNNTYTIDELFKKAIINYGKHGVKPSAEEAWLKNIVDNGGHEAAFLLANLYFCRPVLPYGGTFSYTRKGVRISASDFEPLYELSLLKPSLTQIEMKEDDVYDMEDITVSAYDYQGVNWYGFNQNNSGEWVVESGPAEIRKNAAGNLELKATGAGTAIIRYMPDHIEPSKLSSALDNRGITVNIKANATPVPTTAPATATPTDKPQPTATTAPTDNPANPTTNPGTQATPNANQPTTAPSGSVATAPTATPTTDTTAPSHDTKAAGTTLSKIKINSVICKKKAKKITVKLSVKGATVRVKVGKKAYKTATAKNKTYTLELGYRLKKGTKVIVAVTKNNYTSLKKIYKVK